MSTLPIHYCHDAYIIIMSIHIIEHILHNWGLAYVKIATVSFYCVCILLYIHAWAYTEVAERSIQTGAILYRSILRLNI